MSSTEEPEWLKNLKARMDEAGEDIAKGLGSVFHTLAVSTAMGAMYKGDLDGAPHATRQPAGRAALGGVGSSVRSGVPG